MHVVGKGSWTGSCWKELSNFTVFPTTPWPKQHNTQKKNLIRLRHRHQLQLEQMRAEMKQMQEQHQREKQELERQNFIIQVRPGIFIFKLIDFLIRIIGHYCRITQSLRLRSGISEQPIWTWSRINPLRGSPSNKTFCLCERFLVLEKSHTKHISSHRIALKRLINLRITHFSSHSIYLRFVFELNGSKNVLFVKFRTLVEKLVGSKRFYM